MDEETLARARELRLAGLADNSAGRPDRAARTLRAALRLLPSTSQPASREVELVRVACLLTLAMAELMTSGLEAATERLTQARALAQGDPEMLARCRCQAGIIAVRTQDFARAAQDLQVVVAEPQWFTMQERAAILVNLGVLHFELGHPDEALDAYTAAAQIAKQAGDERLLFMAEHNRGYTRYLTGDLPAALADMAAAEELPAAVHRGPSLFSLAPVLGGAGLLDEAVVGLDRAQAACRPGVDRLLLAEIARERAVLLRLVGRFDEASRAARASRSRFETLAAPGPAASAALIILDCDLSRRRRLPAVLDGALRQEGVARVLGDSDLVARSIAVAAEAAARLGRPEVARAALRRYPRQSHGLVIHLRHVYAAAITDVASGRSPRPRLARAAADLAASQAVSASLDSRAARKVLSLRLAELDLDLAVRRGPSDVLRTLERWTSLGLPVVRPPADPRQAHLTQRLRALSQTLRDEPTPERRAEVARLRRELTDLGFAQRQTAAEADALPGLPDAVDALTVAERDLLWLFGHDGGLWGAGVVGGRRRLGRLTDLERCLVTTRRLPAGLRAGAYQASGPVRGAIGTSLAGGLKWLDEAVVRPWRLRSSGLVVIGTHAVSSVPWGLLPSLVGVPVTVARSATEWAGRRGGAASPSVRVLTGPGLRFAATEARRVAAAWRERPPGADAAASELVAALARAGVVHGAAHGQPPPASPMFSSLQMADGDVYAHELPTGEVRAGHVVLSSCDVGTSQVRPGDEPLGLAHTLLSLGVGSVVAAVAPVPDDETTQVMADYHIALARGLSSDEALAEAGAGSAFVVLGSSWRRVAENENRPLFGHGR